MYQLPPSGMKYLKCLHLVAVACWLGGAVALLVLNFFQTSARSDDMLYGINASSHHIDMLVVVIPGAIGCLLTGLAYSLLTKWGFFKHRWLAAKWFLTITAILSGTFLLGEWENRLLERSATLGLSALNQADYLSTLVSHRLGGIAQLAILVFMIWLSVWKPWGRKAKV